MRSTADDAPEGDGPLPRANGSARSKGNTKKCSWCKAQTPKCHAHGQSECPMKQAGMTRQEAKDLVTGVETALVANEELDARDAIRAALAAFDKTN